MQKNTSKIIKLSENRPKWLQIATSLRHEIESLAHKGIERLPTEAELAKQFNVSTLTVRQALAVMEEQELIVRKRKHGTFISRKALQPRQIWMIGKISEVFSQQKSDFTELLSCEKIATPASLAEHFTDQDEVMRIVRSRYMDGKPGNYAINHLRLDVADAINFKSLEQLPVSQVIMEETKFTIGVIEQELIADIATPEVAQHLNIEPLEPVMKLTGRTYDNHKRLMDHAQISYRGDAYSFVSRVGGNSD